METCEPTDTPMVEKSKLDEDPQGKAVDPTRYRGMIGTLIIQRISLTGFPAQSVGSSNTDVLELPFLLVLITETSQSRQHVDTSLIHIEPRQSPTESLFDVGSSRISIVIMNTKMYHSDVLAESQG
ncbi:hypothetical protein Tco_1296881 [Tanacetum coccineum]